MVRGGDDPTARDAAKFNATMNFLAHIGALMARGEVELAREHVAELDDVDKISLVLFVVDLMNKTAGWLQVQHIIVVGEDDED